MKRILVALDLSAHADRAFARAVQIAREHEAELVLAHIVPQDSIGDNSGAALERVERELRDYASPLDVKAQFRVSVGDPAREIATLVREIGADLAILGLHHENTIGDLFFETVAHFAIQHGGAPVLLVKERAQNPYRRALVTTDFSQCAKRALRAAIALAKNAKFHLLHVYETPFPQFIRFQEDELREFQDERLSRIEKDLQEEMSDFMSRGMDRQFPEITPMLERNDVEAGIAKVVRQLQPDLLAMGMSGVGFAAPGGSRTRAYLNNPPCDMLVTA